MLVITDGRYVLVRLNLLEDDEYKRPGGSPRPRMPGDPIPAKSRFDK